jgi:hypothetical protein
LTVRRLPKWNGAVTAAVDDEAPPKPAEENMLPAGRVPMEDSVEALMVEAERAPRLDGEEIAPVVDGERAPVVDGGESTPTVDGRDRVPSVAMVSAPAVLCWRTPVVASAELAEDMNAAVATRLDRRRRRTRALIPCKT